jgi:hypothetical protein
MCGAATIGNGDGRVRRNDSRGGPTGKLVEDKLKPESLRTLGGRKVKSKVVGGVGSPRRQLDASEAVV